MAVENIPDQRTGGADTWSPRVTPPIGIELTDQQSLACALRILAKSGFSENMAGHITMAKEGSASVWINPWGLWWNEVKASDVCLVDPDGRVEEGKWDVTPAYHIHTELHRVRPDARVVIHNHPYFVTVLAAVGRLPEFLHQTSAMFDDDIVFVDEYTGEVDSAEQGAELAVQIGDKSVAILANHGVIVTASNIQDAMYLSASIDRVCRLTYDVMSLGLKPTIIPVHARYGIKKSLRDRAPDVFWAGEVRALIRESPEVLR